MRKLISGMAMCTLLLTANPHQAQTLGWADEPGTVAKQEPVPVGWEGEPLREFLQAHLRYPQLALENCVEGEVWLLLRFSDKGSLLTVDVLEGIGFGCDEEAIRLTMLLSVFDPGTAMGPPPSGAIRKLGIRFRLR